MKNCSILEDSCGEIVDSLVTCRNLTRLVLSQNTIGKYGHQLSNMIRQWGDNPPLQELALENCSILEDSCGEIVECLSSCINLVELNFSDNTVGKYGHQFADSIRQWGNNPPLQELNLFDCYIPKEASCDILNALFECTRLTWLSLTGRQLCEDGLHVKRYLETITGTLEGICLDRCFIPLEVSSQIVSVLSRCKNLYHMSLPGNVLTGTLSQFIPHPPLEHLDISDAALNKEDVCCVTSLIVSGLCPSLAELRLDENSLNEMEDELACLITACIDYQEEELTIYLSGNELSLGFITYWMTKCESTDITLDFDKDIDARNAEAGL